MDEINFLVFGSLFLLGIGYLRAPFICWMVVIGGMAWGVGASVNLLYVIGGLTCLGLLRPIRQHLVSRWIMKIVQVLKIFPRVSETERIALEAGTVWIDKDLFSGHPDLDKVLAVPYPRLSEEEQAFLNGPVETLCEMIDNWQIHQSKEIPESVWHYIKKEGFFGMIIPKVFGGLELSALAHSAVIAKISSRSPAVAITVMVPNSLGPAELLIHYGTDDQKNYYLPRLARGEEVPCFGLTEPTAGSDAGAIQAKGIIHKDENDAIKIRLNWEKRWITLSGVSTVIGLAFKLEDPDNILGEGQDLGITCALIPSDTSGIDISKQHDPMGVPFVNCPLTGVDVVIDLDCIIGGVKGVGKGWQMLMECLSAGRGISLPALCTGGIQKVLKVASAFSTVRQQFGVSIGVFEGIEEPLARIGGLTYALDAARIMTCGAIDAGEKPGVISAIVKYQFTERFREAINDGLDIQGGAGISLGPRNQLASDYFSAPIGITVEGANILTRCMIIFGQGALRCHPFAYDEITASNRNDSAGFDKAFWGHIHHVVCQSFRSVMLSITRGWISMSSWGKPFGKYRRRIVWASASFAILSDLVMMIYGGKLKMKEKITGRFSDILSWLYIATAILRRYDADGQNKADRVFAEWGLAYACNEMQTAFDGIFENLGPIFRVILGTWSRVNRIGVTPSDKIGAKIASQVQVSGEQRARLMTKCYQSTDAEDGLWRLENAFQKVNETSSILRRVKREIRAKKLPKKPILELIDLAVQYEIITQDEAEQLREAETYRLDAIQVDAFTKDGVLSIR